MGTVTCSCGGFSLVQHGELTAQLLGKESRVPSVPTAPESQGSCSEGATAPSAPPQLAFHLSQAPCTHHPPHPFPSTPLLGACWVLAACGAAEQQQQMRHGPEKRDAPPGPHLRGRKRRCCRAPEIRGTTGGLRTHPRRRGRCS